MIVLDKLEKHEKVLEVLRGELGEWLWAWLAYVGVVKRWLLSIRQEAT